MATRDEIEKAVDQLIETARRQGGEQRDSMWRGSEDALAAAWQLDCQLSQERAALLALIAALGATAR